MRKKLTKDEIIGRFISIHGDKYDYSLVEYIGRKIKVKIICKNHGMFECTPNNHLKGSGCYHCGIKSMGVKNSDTKEIFVEKAKLVHKNKYDYIFVEYINSHKKVTIICPIHGEFKQTPNAHLSGRGCNLGCSKRNIWNTEYFVNRVIDIHGYKYIIIDSEYKGSNSNISLICKIHGVFYKKASRLLLGEGCQKCGYTNKSINREKDNYFTTKKWSELSLNSKHFDSFKVYIIMCWNDDELFFKIGRTYTTINRRFITKREMPYQYAIIDTYVFDTAKEAFDKENEIKKSNKENKYLPKINFGGMYECFLKINLDL